MKKRSFIGTAIFILVLVAVFLNQIVNFIINVKWFSEVGYLSIYFTKITATLKLMIPIFIICFAAIWFYYKSIKKSIIRWKTVVEVDSLKEKRERKTLIVLDTLISLFISFSFASTYWYRILQFTNATTFNVKDPIFNKDISFFIFKLPLIQSIYEAVISLLIFLVVITVFMYFAMNAKDRLTLGRQGDKRFSKITDFKSGITKFAGKQLAVVGALVLLCISLGYSIKAWNLVYSPRGVVFGASYTDTYVTLRFYKIIVVVALISAVVVFVSVLKSKVKPIIISVVLIAVLIVSEGIVSGLWQNFVVKSNEKRLETPFIENNIKYTKQAFDIDGIEQKSYPLKNNLTKQSIQENRATVDNIKINSVAPALEFYNQVESKKNYYEFNDMDIDRYSINGKYTQVFISPREVDYQKLKDKANTWQSKHLIYTHGYGVVMSKVNSVTSEGKPDFIIKDMPIKNTSGIKIDNPRIYFGEKTNEYAVVNTNLKELDYAKETGENAGSNYDGKAGIKMNLLNRILLSINKRDMNFLLSRDITNESKILIHRNVLERVKKIAPFLIYDSDPYVVVNNGRLYWIIDAYTASDRYPFSEPINGVNYIRNSVKVIVDAVDGTTDFYIIDKSEPVINSYSKIFPKLFKDIKEVPEGFKEHFRYPEDYFITQCKVMEKYHVNNADSFFGSTNIWDIARNQKKVEGQDTLNEAAYVIMKLPGEANEEMVLIQYFNQYQRENMIALFGARMDKDNYGKLALYKFPTGTGTVNSPILFKQKINQDTTISKELSLWNKEGSQVQFGDTMIIPIDNSLLYIEPLYLRAQGERSIPEMKRVVVSYGDKMVLAQNIEEALKQLFNYEDKKDTVDIIEDDSTVSESSVLIKEAKELYNKALEAQKNGDWAKYGEYIQSLGKRLNSLK
ncbi:UPF0182 family protein [Clostridium ganghwense]|uniref:UPF0182 protein OXH55_19100 n=1 Tax=Clostridium ganghwense TaxID=312089 RepID=A0ABT4CUH5_9CLOT|nr:UPF0182 family protein [Clostridium ganghwense]MCY6372710.1 UPF0182 family protein [Clostridium ganghwense]